MDLNRCSRLPRGGPTHAGLQVVEPPHTHPVRPPWPAQQGSPQLELCSQPPKPRPAEHGHPAHRRMLAGGCAEHTRVWRALVGRGRHLYCGHHVGGGPGLQPGAGEERGPRPEAAPPRPDWFGSPVQSWCLEALCWWCGVLPPSSWGWQQWPRAGHRHPPSVWGRGLRGAGWGGG